MEWITPSKMVTLLSLAFLVGCAAEKAVVSQPIATPSGVPTQGMIRIYPAEIRQTIEGFGASGAWWAQDVGGWEDARERVVQLLFDPEEGIGLSIYRYNIGGGDGQRIPDRWRRAESFEVAPGEYDWSRDANAIWVLKAAQQAGVEQFVAFANSPPARMTASGRTNGDPDNLSNLRPDMYAQFAQYLVDVVRHLQADEGVPIGWLSPINEPQWEWLLQSGQEGSHYEPAEVAAMAKALIHAVQDQNLEVKISLFESGEWWRSGRPYIPLLLDDPDIASHIDHLAIHSYWSGPEDKERLRRYLDNNYAGIPIEMTEWTEMEQGCDISIDSGLVLANTIHDDLTIGRVISWQYWIAVSKYSFHDGLLYVALNDHEITETKRLWALGNYSRYVRPGYHCLAVESGLPDLKVTAFSTPDESRLVVVAINNEDRPLTVDLAGIPANFRRMTGHETSAERNLGAIYDGDVPAKFAFAPKSVTTLVYQR